MNEIIDKVTKLTILASSEEEALKIVKEKTGIKKIVDSKLLHSVFEFTVIQEYYGKYNLGYCSECKTDLCCRLEFYTEMCDTCSNI